jgi:hypothetical protein
MARRNRETLKNFFRRGSLPDEDQFKDLIDSSLNIIDEGFSRSINQGLEIGCIDDSNKLMGFFKNVEDNQPVWSIALNKETGNLDIINQNEDPVLSLSPDGKIGIKTDTPENDLDINGVISYKAKTGNLKQGKVPADGKWHPVLSNLKGCQALEIMAGVGKKGTGKYALAHAVALNTFFSNKKIKINQSYYRRACNKLKFRWTGNSNSYNLEIRTKMNYGDQTQISYHISKLWLNTFME